MSFRFRSIRRRRRRRRRRCRCRRHSRGRHCCCVAVACMCSSRGSGVEFVIVDNLSERKHKMSKINEKRIKQTHQIIDVKLVDGD